MMYLQASRKLKFATKVIHDKGTNNVIIKREIIKMDSNSGMETKNSRFTGFFLYMTIFKMKESFRTSEAGIGP